jgi:hypothetical protein
MSSTTTVLNGVPNRREPKGEGYMTKIVVDNSAPEGRQRQLQAQVQVAWAKAACSVLNFLIGRGADPVTAMKEFVTVHEAAEQESTDPNGIAIRGPKLGQTTNGHPDEIIDTVLTGSLSMVAAMLQVGAKQPISEPKGAYTDDEAYVAAQERIVRGMMMMEKQIRKKRDKS